MTASASIGTCASEILDAAVDPNMAVYHLALRAGQSEEFCRWLRRGGFRSIAEAWQACGEPQWMMGLLDAFGPADAGKLRLFAVRAVRDMPIGAGRTAAALMDRNVRGALDVGERFAAGAADLGKLRAAHDLAAAAGRKGHGRCAAKRRLACAASAALVGPGLFDALVVASMAGKLACWGIDAKRFQAELLRKIFGDPFAR